MPGKLILVRQSIGAAVIVLVSLQVMAAVGAPRASMPRVHLKPPGAAEVQTAALQPSAPARTLREAAPPLSRSGLAVPRWVSLRASRTNVRQGPSIDQPVLWTYVREGLPVEIIAEFDTWRRIRDRSGEIGWVKQQMLEPRRSVIVASTENVALLATPTDPETIRAYAAPGLVAHFLGCEGAWCQIEAKGYQGFVPRARLWGVYAHEGAAKD